MNTHIITKDTQFPIIQNGKSLDISANELLNNIVAILNVSNYRESTKSIKQLTDTVNELKNQIITLQEQYRELISRYSILVDSITRIECKNK